MLFIGDSDFIEREDQELTAAGLLAKPVKQLTLETPLAFNSYKLIIGDDRSISAIPKD
jgi:hypothetical protein